MRALLHSQLSFRGVLCEQLLVGALFHNQLSLWRVLRGPFLDVFGRGCVRCILIQHVLIHLSLHWLIVHPDRGVVIFRSKPRSGGFKLDTERVLELVQVSATFFFIVSNDTVDIANLGDLLIFQIYLKDCPGLAMEGRPQGAKATQYQCSP